MRISRIIILLALFLAASTASYGRTYEVVVAASDLVLTDPEENVHVFKVALPRALGEHRTEFATIEFFIEMTSAAGDSLPYSLILAPLETFSAAENGYSITPGNWPGYVGITTNSCERIRLDITNVVESWLQAAGGSFGIIYKAAGEEGIHSALRTNELGSGVAARIRIYAVAR